MDFYFSLVLSLCIAVPVILALARFNKISNVYKPFIYYLILGLLNESLSIWLILNGHYNTVNSNFYMALASVLLLWQFRKWGFFIRNHKLYVAIVIILTITWIIENLYYFDINHYDSYYRITYSFIICLMSISVMSHLIVTERKRLVMNPIFIICTAFILFFTFSVLSEAFWIYGISVNAEFTIKIQDISVITNFIAILLYTVAILWMPSKQKFTLPSS